jgi:hypothetical protein
MQENVVMWVRTILLGIFNALLFLALIAYIGMTLAFAYVVVKGAMTATSVSDFDKAAIGALIAVVGTGLTALGALYTVNRQAEVSSRIEMSRKTSTEDLAKLQHTLSLQIKTMDEKSDASLERLKRSLDFNAIANREIMGAAAQYFYALRSAAIHKWEEKELDKAEILMIAASSHLLYVSDEVEQDWLSFWQEAQSIAQRANAKTDLRSKMKSVEDDLSSARPDGETFRKRFADLKTLSKKELADRS